MADAAASRAEGLSPVALGSGPGGFFRGVLAVFAGLGRLVSDRRLRKLAVAPLLITAVLYAIVFVAAAFFASDALGMVWEKPEGWLVYVWYVLVPIIFIAVILVLSLLFVSIAGVIAGPFYDEMVGYVLGAHGVQTRSVGLARGVAYELARSLLFFIPSAFFASVGFLLGFVPFLGFPFVVIGTGLAWLGLGSTAINPALVATGSPLRDQLGAPFRSFLVVLGMGAIVGLSLVIPVLGLISVPSAVVGATDLYAKALRTTPPRPEPRGDRPSP